MKIHTLKGISANLGSKYIPNLCEILEKEIDITKFVEFNKLELEIERVAKEIYTIKNKEKVIETEIFSREILKGKLEQLIEILESFDVKLEKVFYSIKETLMSMEYKEEVKSIEMFLKKYEFEEAEKISKKIYKEFI